MEYFSFSSTGLYAIFMFFYMYTIKLTIYFYICSVNYHYRDLNNTKIFYTYCFQCFSFFCVDSDFFSDTIFLLPEAYSLTFLMLWICFCMFENVCFAFVFGNIFAGYRLLDWEKFSTLTYCFTVFLLELFPLRSLILYLCSFLHLFFLWMFLRYSIKNE